MQRGSVSRFQAPLRDVVWSNIKWEFRRLRKAMPDIIAGIAFMGIMLSLPILAGFIIG